jgi:hypothetical protein
MLLGLVTLVAGEERRQLVNANLQQQANLLEDKITRLIRPMSAREAVVLGDPIQVGSPFYHQIIVARGPNPTPREQLAYQPATFTCTHIPDIAAPSPGVKETYFAPSVLAVLRNMYFFISEKNDGAPDSSAISVVFQLDDNGMAMRDRTNVVTRSFTASMRNN